jgi:hypothetical protein
MSKKCDRDSRIRLHPDNKRALENKRRELGLTISLPALANDILRAAIAAFPSVRPRHRNLLK